MAGNEARRQVAVKQRISRIRAAEATKLLEECDRFFAASSALLGNLRCAGITGLLRALNERILLLAVQPDAWGERTRARLISVLAPALADDLSDDSALSVEDIVRISNSVLPCFLLEIGRRRQHIQIEFPLNPAEFDAVFNFAPEPLRQAHSVSREQLLKLMNVAGEEMVGLCYFGDEESRGRIEACLNHEQTTSSRPCRTSPYLKRPQ
jgi:hypothetical protein